MKRCNFRFGILRAVIERKRTIFFNSCSEYNADTKLSTVVCDWLKGTGTNNFVHCGGPGIQPPKFWSLQLMKPPQEKIEKRISTTMTASTTRWKMTTHECGMTTFVAFLTDSAKSCALCITTSLRYGSCCCVQHVRKGLVQRTRDKSNQIKFHNAGNKSYWWTNNKSDCKYVLHYTNCWWNRFCLGVWEPPTLEGVHSVRATLRVGILGTTKISINLYSELIFVFWKVTLSAH